MTLAELIVFIRARPEMIESLLAGHGDDGDRRCRSCSLGTSRGRQLFPCTIYSAALRARSETLVPVSNRATEDQAGRPRHSR